MIVYHGTGDPDLQIRKGFFSRYKFVALFTTTNIELARLYARYYREESWLYLRQGGYLYEIEVDGEVDYHADFEGRHSYQGDFKRLVQQMQSAWVHLGHISNVVDFPSFRLKTSEPSDIFVIYNLKLIKSVKLIENEGPDNRL
jgi:hypothetical protein